MKTFRFAVICAALVAPIAVSSFAVAQQKTEKQCREEWQANKAANQAAKITEKSYVEKCRAGGAAAQPTTAPAPTAAPAPAAAPAAKTKIEKKSAPAAAAGTPSGANQFAAESQAKARCPSDTVVWVNLKSKVYHFAGKKDYGNTKEGAYMCEKDATGSGMRAA